MNIFKTCYIRKWSYLVIMTRVYAYLLCFVKILQLSKVMLVGQHSQHHQSHTQSNLTGGTAKANYLEQS